MCACYVYPVCSPKKVITKGKKKIFLIASDDIFAQCISIRSQYKHTTSLDSLPMLMW